MVMKPKVHTAALEEFQPARQNTNAHSELGMGLLEDSMRRDGYTTPMVAAADYEMLNGSARLEKAATVFDGREAIVVESDGQQPIVVIRTDIEHADSEQGRRIAAMDNRVAQVNLSYAADVVKQLADDKVIDGKMWGNREEFAAIMRSLVAKRGEPPDSSELIKQAEALRVKWDVNPGDLYRIPSRTGAGYHLVLCADSTDPANIARVLEGQKFALMFTDPPYGVAYDNSLRGGGRRSRGKIANDELEGATFEAFLDKFLATVKPHMQADAVYYICCADKTLHQVLMALRLAELYYSALIVWHKQHFALSYEHYKIQHESMAHGGPGAAVIPEIEPEPVEGPEGYRIDHGWLLHAGDGAKSVGVTTRWFGPRNESTVWQIARDSHEAYEHPSQKPVALPQRAIKNSTRPDEIVFDPFAGSGSTLAACELLGRLGRGVELEPRFVAVILERLARLDCVPEKVVL